MKINTVIKWTALVLTLTGALFTSLRIDPWNIYALNCGSFLYLIWSLRVKDVNLVVVNAGLLTIYVIGLFFTA